MRATQERYPKALCVVYTGDHDVDKDTIIENVKNRFNIPLYPPRLTFLYLNTRDFLLAQNWPHFTLLGQSIGSLIVGWDAFNLLVPDIFIDTMGYAFTVAFSHALFPEVPTGAYVHYPTISTDMLGSLDASGRGVNAGLGSGWKGTAKKAYWHLFAKLYSWIGGEIDVVMTNSTWTQNHIRALWAKTRQKRSWTRDTFVVFPPVAVEELEEAIEVTEESEKSRKKEILYIAQFRPEKDHQNIIMAFAEFLRSRQADKDPKDTPRLVLVGSVRDEKDKMLVYKLRVLAREQHVADHVDFIINAKWTQIMDYLRTSWIGVNGMWNEHFGIGVVEYQAAGLISVVDDSGGPKYDIVVPIDGQPTGNFCLLFQSSLHVDLYTQASTPNLPPSSPKALQKHSTSHPRKHWLCGNGPARAQKGFRKRCLGIVGTCRWIDWCSCTSRLERKDQNFISSRIDLANAKKKKIYC